MLLIRKTFSASAFSSDQRHGPAPQPMVIQHADAQQLRTITDRQPVLVIEAEFLLARHLLIVFAVVSQPAIS